VQDRWLYRRRRSRSKNDPAIRKRFGKKVRIILRGDGGFAREEIMAWCESQPELYYCLGYSVNPRLKKAVAAPLWKLRLKACVLKGTKLEKATIGQVRLKLFKIAVRIKVSVRRELLEIASSYPRKKLFEECIGNLDRLDQMLA